VLADADVVDAAFRVIDENGFAKLSMRAVARELGVPTMTIYGYVPNKDALDALLIDRILGEVHIPGPDHGTWDERLLFLLCDARRTLVERPQLNERRAELGAGALALLSSGGFGREASRLADGVIELLRQGGFRADDLDDCFTTLFIYVTGHVDASDSGSTRGSLASSSTIARRSSDEVFALGARALIDGLESRLVSTPSPTPTESRRRGHH
jgi:AcrR family transcriptional regulator